MAKYTNAEIAADLGLWNEYFNTSALMSDAEFEEMAFEDRLAMINQAYPEDGSEEDRP